MKQFILLILFISIFPLCHAQEEVFFNDINIDKKEIKVAKVVSGIEFNSDLFRLFRGTFSGSKFGSVETTLSYFHENRIANNWTLNKSIGLGNSAYRVYEYSNSTNGYYGYSDNERVIFQYVLSMELKIEPRWYFDQRLRYKHNKNIRNNTGWFLSLPLTLTTDLMRQPVHEFSTNWFPQNLSFMITAPATIGYRNAFAKNWFMEVSAGYIPYRAWFVTGSPYTNQLFHFSSAKVYGILSTDNFNSELKIAYTF